MFFFEGSHPGEHGLLHEEQLRTIYSELFVTIISYIYLNGLHKHNSFSQQMCAQQAVGAAWRVQADSESKKNFRMKRVGVEDGNEAPE
jgi:hypothetical protein